MRPIRITDKLAVAGQPNPEDFSRFAADGFAAVVNNRPDGEEPGQPGNAAEQAAAGEAGLGLHPYSGCDPDYHRGGYPGVPGGGRPGRRAGAGPLQGRRPRAHAACPRRGAGRSHDRRATCPAFGARFGFDLKGAEGWLGARATRQRPAGQGLLTIREPTASSMSSPIPRRSAARLSIRCSTSTRSPARSATANADAILAYVDGAGLTVDWILDTHPHADHFSAAHYLKQKNRRADRDRRAGRGCAEAVEGHLQLAGSLPTDGSQWDRLFAEGRPFQDRLASMR